MPFYQAQNLVVVELASGGIDASQTTLPLATGEGAKLDATITDGVYPLPLWNASQYHNPHEDPEMEIVLVTSHDGSSDTISVISRGAEGTSGVAHNASGITYKALAGFTADMFDKISPIRNHHVAATFNANKVARKLYYPHTGSLYLMGSTVNYSMTIYYTFFLPFIPEKTGTTDEMFIVRSGASSAGGRLGIYDTVSETDLSPGLNLYDSGQLALSDLGATAAARWNCNPSASVTWKRGKYYWLAVTLSGTQNVNGIISTAATIYPMVGFDWVDVSTLNFYNQANIALGLGTNYYDAGFPADLTAIQFSNMAGGVYPNVWFHWET